MLAATRLYTLAVHPVCNEHHEQYINYTIEMLIMKIPNVNLLAYNC